VAASALLDRYGTAVRTIEDDGFDIAARVYMVLEGENLATMAKTTGLGLLELATVFDNLKPDVVVTVADRYETLATAVAASYMNIPVAHVQGGEVTGSIDEKVRHAVTKLADLHFVSTEKAAERVVRMGEEPEKVFVTGCPSIDLAVGVLERPELDFDPFAKYGGVGASVDLAGGYMVVMQHSVTTEYELARDQAMETLHAVAEVGLPTLWFWPNVDAGSDGTSNAIRAFRELHSPRNMHFFKNMQPTDFLRLLANARCLLGNSSVGIRECAYLGVPTVNIGTRQSGRDRGRNVLDVDYRREEIVEAVGKHLRNGRYPSDPIYGHGQAGERIAALLAEQPLGIEKRLTY
jgi:UDP-hydrolysing UDP-N-acetyl-D-glucosamine 2-epimerase